jgi:hypothetical protein
VGQPAGYLSIGSLHALVRPLEYENLKKNRALPITAQFRITRCQLLQHLTGYRPRMTEDPLFPITEEAPTLLLSLIQARAIFHEER